MTASTISPVSDRYWLVDDDPIVVKVKGEDHLFRLRVWRCKTRPAVVLVTQVEGHPAPARATARIANIALRNYLGYDGKGMFFVERNGEDYRVVDFVGVGNPQRLTLTRPEGRATSHAKLEALVGGPVES